jgi:succinate dehydrogenase / fumarate reductase, cytochrome b subunit
VRLAAAPPDPDGPGRGRPGHPAGAPEEASPVQAPAGTLYRGREGMWTWVGHRVTGVLIFFFLFAHVLDTALVRVSPDAYNQIMDTYKTPVVNLMEVGLVGAVLYHALNGLRVMAIDFWSKGTRYQKQMSWAVMAVVLLVMIPGTYYMVEHTVRDLFGSTS